MQGLCDVVLPSIIEVEPGHDVRCHIYTEEGKAWMQKHGKREIGKIPSKEATVS